MHRLDKRRRAASRIVSVFVFMFMLAVTVNAYTIVMRGGRRIEIPSQFVVTPSTLTYEAGSGVQITLQMAVIDIVATERVNNEQPGSLMRRLYSTTAASTSTNSAEEDAEVEQPTQAKRTITNRDLESTMRRRRESEFAYESRRKQLGLPTVAESRRRTAIESQAIGVELDQRRNAERDSEEYWRGRAGELRTEMASLDAEIAYTRARLDEGPFPVSGAWGNGSLPTITTVDPYSPWGNNGRRPYGNGNYGNGNYGNGTYGNGTYGNGTYGNGTYGNGTYRNGTYGNGTYGNGNYGRGYPGRNRPDIFTGPGENTRRAGRGYGGRPRGRGVFDPWIFPQARPVYPGVDVFGSNQPYDSSAERSDLVTRLNELSATRAGLNARWRQLEEEARRAGAPPGWLRP